MKTFKEFISEDAVKVQKAWQDWMDANPQEFARGGRFYEKGSNEKINKGANEFRKHYMKTGKPPEWAQFTRDVETAKSSSTKQATPQPPKQATQTRQPSASTPPPPSTPPRNVPSTAVKPPVPKGPGLRSRLKNIAGPAGAVASGALEYKTRRDEGQSKARATGGALASGAGWAKGAQIGASLASKLPIPNPLIKTAVVGAGGLAGGLAGDTAASAAYDFAVNKTRPARQAISKAIGYDKFKQKNELIKNAKPGQGLQSLARAQQTVDTRGAREVAAKAGTYGARQGSAITGIGPRTTFNQRAGTITSQGRTANLASTQLVRDPKTGQQRVGDLAYKGGKAVYLARPSVASRDTSLTARLGRALNIGRYSRDAEQQAARQEYRTALKNTQTYQKQLGITPTQATTQKLPGR